MDAAAFRQAALDRNIFGRIAPEQKERVVESLGQAGAYVAMIGNGISDVLSLKKANLGIAMQSGSAATRAVADMMLLDDSFAALPLAFREGQRIINGMNDILRLFLTRVLYSALLIIAISVIGLGFPFIPLHNALLAFLTVGAPTFALNLWARPAAVNHQSALKGIAHFAVPASIAIYTFGLLVYIGSFYLSNSSLLTVDVTPEAIAAFEKFAGLTYPISTPSQYVLEVSQIVAQTSLTAFVVFAGLGLVVLVKPPVAWLLGAAEVSGDWRPTALAGALLLVFFTIVASPPLASLFELMPLPPVWYAALALVAFVCLLCLRLMWRNRWLERFVGIES